MKLTTTLMTSTAMVIAGTSAFADAHMADQMTIVSWGGAYSASQQGAYHDPYSEKTGVTIVNDESSAEAVAKLRAMSEANNVTWDVVDVVASDAIRLCDEGLAMEIDFDTQLANGDDARCSMLGVAGFRAQSSGEGHHARDIMIAPIIALLVPGFSAFKLRMADFVL